MNNSTDPVQQSNPPTARPASTVTEYTFSRQHWLETFLKGVLRISVVLGLILLVASVATNTETILLIIYSAALLALIVATFLPLPYQIRAGLFLFLLFALGVSSLLENGIRADSRTFFPVFIIMTALLYGHRAGLYAGILTVVAGVAIGVPILTGHLGLIDKTAIPGTWDAWIMAYLVNILLALLVNTGLRTLQEEYIRAERRSLLNLDLLTEERNTLDLRVQERTSELQTTSAVTEQRARQLETIAEVAHQISQVQDIAELLPLVTSKISESLGFYHVGIFLVDEKKEYAILMAANSTGGQHMLQRGHRLRVGQVGIVGYVADQAHARISLDVGSDAVYFDNPDLPQTHSEMALPLLIGKELIGVMDVQSEKVSAFSQQDIDVMGTLANQVAVAIENARRFGETRQALSEAQSLYSQYLQQGWQQLSLEKNAIGYIFNNSQTKPLVKPMDRSEIQSALTSGEIVIQSENNPNLAIPLKVRNEIVGVLNISSKLQERVWNENEIALVKAVSERVALALENARLFEETTHRADRERMVSDITTHIRTATDPQTMLQTALDDLKRALGASDIQIRPYSPPTAGQSSGNGHQPTKTES